MAKRKISKKSKSRVSASDRKKVEKKLKVLKAKARQGLKVGMAIAKKEYPGVKAYASRKLKKGKVIAKREYKKFKKEASRNKKLAIKAAVVGAAVGITAAALLRRRKKK